MSDGMGLGYPIPLWHQEHRSRAMLKNIFCVKWDKMKCVAPSVSSHRRISISPARNCFNIQELPEFQECKRKTTAAGQIWKNNRVLSSFHKHFHSEAAPHWSLSTLIWMTPWSCLWYGSWPPSCSSCGSRGRTEKSAQWRSERSWRQGVDC